MNEKDKVVVKALRRYLDIDRAEIMEPDQQFEVTAMRAQKLVSLGYVELVEPEIMPAPEPDPEPEAAAPAKKPAPKKTTRKKKTE